MSILTVLPFTEKDWLQAGRLLGWIEELGGCGDKDILLLVDCKLNQPDNVGIGMAWSKACHCYRSVHISYTPYALKNETWPIGANWMFETALQHTATSQGPWLWLEPDCVPMRRGWMDEIEDAHAKSHQPFWGQIIVTKETDNLPRTMLSGVAIYPADAKERLLQTVQLTRHTHAFDVATALLTIPHTQHTRLIWNFIGERDLPPTFVREKTPDSPRNAMTLEQIPKTTALYHRCKNGSLIQLLRENLK